MRRLGQTLRAQGVADAAEAAGSRANGWEAIAVGLLAEPEVCFGIPASLERHSQSQHRGARVSRLQLSIFQQYSRRSRILSRPF